MSCRTLFAALAALTLPGALALAQSNDNFSDRIALTSASATVVTNNAKATLEPGEPNHAGQSAGRSLWWTWKAPGSGLVNFSVFDGGAVTNPVRHTLAVYTGDALDNLTPVAATGGAASLDTAAVSTTVADFSVNVQATAGTVYQIAVDDCHPAAGSDGTIVLGINQAPVIVSQVTATATVKSSFSYVVQAANQPTSYAASGLPAGLAINPTTGGIGGTPTAAGTYVVQLSAANAGGTGTAVLTLTVNPAQTTSSSSTVSPPTLIGVASAKGAVGAVFSLSERISGDDTGTEQVTGLPPGLQYDGFFANIAGTPTTPGVYPVTFSASNAGGTLNAVVTIVIAAQPNLPVISSALAASATAGKSFSYSVTSQTYDAGSPIRYAATSLPPGLGLDALSGQIGGVPTTPGVYAVSLSATNAAGTSWAAVTITVDPPAAAAAAAPFFNGPAVQSLQLNAAVSMPLAVSNSPTSFTASNLPPGLSLNLANGYLIGTPTTLGDYLVPITATNAYGTTSVALTLRVVSVLNVTDSLGASTLIITSPASASTVAGNAFSYSIVAAVPSSVTATKYVYAYTATGLPSGLTLNSASGAISGAAPAAGTYAIDIGCIYYPDSSTASAGFAVSRLQTPPATLTLVVRASAAPVTAVPQLSYPANIGLTTDGTYYSYGGSATNSPTAFSASGLPPGMSFSTSTGTLSGTPTTAGTYPVNITATNAVGTGSVTVTIIVSPAPVSATSALPKISADAFDTGTVGTSFYGYVSATNSPTSYAASGLPPGLAMSATSGSISGTPSAAGDYNVSISATNSSGTSTVPMLLRIALPTAPVISSYLTATGYVGGAFSYSLYAGNATVAVDAASLPPGLSFSGSLISGTPTAAGVYAVPVSATSAGGAANATLTVTIAAAPPTPVMSGKAVYSGAVGQSFSYAITPGGASGGYAAAGLPGGLTLNAATGVISGTPTAGGTYNVPISAANAGGTTNATVTFVIASSTASSGLAPVISSPAATYGIVGAPFSYQIAAANSPTGFDSGALPPGLSINFNTGVISGTPTTAGTFVTSVSAYNVGPAGSNSGSAKVTMTFTSDAVAPPTISSPALVNAYAYEPFTYQITASDAPTSFAFSGYPYSYDLTFNASLGLAYGTIRYYGSSSANMTLTASNSHGSGTAILALQTVSAIPAALARISTAAAVKGTVGTSFAYTVATNLGTSAFTYTSSTGLPPGVTYNSSTKQLSGTPTKAGSYVVTFTSSAYNASATVVIDITAAASTAPTITNDAGYNAYVGEPFLLPLQVSTNSTASLTAASLPPGFSFDPATRLLSGTPMATGTFKAQFNATNATGSSNATLTIKVSDASYAPPRVTSPAAQEGFVGAPFSYKIGANFSASGYYSSNGSLPLGLTLNSTTGEISGTPKQSGTYAPTIQVYTSNGGSKSFTPTFVIRGTPVAPPVVFSAAGAAGALGAPFSYALSATNLPTGFSVGALPAGLSFDSSANVISGVPTVSGQFSVPITAVNALGQGSATLTIALSALPPAPSLASSDLAATTILGVTGVVYRISATNGPTSYGATNLPPGLSLDPVNGIISGTAATAGVYPVTISAANAGGSASAVVTLTVTNQAPVITGPALMLGIPQNVSYRLSLGVLNNPTRYAASGLPPGLYLDTLTGIVSGAATMPGVYPVTYTASNAVGSATATQTLVVSAPIAPDVSSSFDSYYDAKVGSTFSDTFFASGSGTLVCSAIGLPPGVALIPSSFTVSLRGVPEAAGVYPVTITLSYQGGPSVSFNLIINVQPLASVNAAPLINSNAGATGVVGTAFTYRLTGSNNPTGFTASGLPDGLTLGAAGLISGTPTQAGNYPVAVSATNATGTVNAVVTLAIASVAPASVVYAPLITSSATLFAQATITPQPTSALANGQAYTYQVAASGSPSAYTASGLPPGLSINPDTGLVFGRPGAAGTYRASVTAANAVGVGSATLTFVVPAFAPTFYGTVLELAGTVGNSFSYTISTSVSNLNRLGDGSSYVAFSASGLPPGLTINPATGQITGTPTRAGNYPVTLSANGSANPASYATTFAISPSAALISVPTFTSRAAIIGLVGAPFNQSIRAANASSYAASGLPAGLILDPATGAIVGTPTAAGVFYVTVSAANAGGATQAMLTLLVVGQSVAPTLANSTLASGTVGQPFAFTVSATSSGAPFDVTAYGVSNLPPGLSFDAAQHQIIGTPTQAGTFVIPLSASSYGATAQASLSLRLLPATAGSVTPAKPIIGARAGLLGFVANPLSFGLGNAVPDAADLPGGVSFDPAQGLLAGYPTAAGLSLVDLNAANDAGTSQAALSLRIIAPALSLPRLVTLPATQTVADQGTGVTLSSLAVGIPAPAYQWRRDGAILPGATSPTLTLSNVQAADMGAYTLTATNSSGSVTAPPASVFIRATYGMWQTSHFTAPEIAAGLANDLADFNGDGVVNLLEYALGRDPRTGRGSGLPVVSLSAGRDRLQLQFSRDASKTDVGYVVEATSDLLTWSAIASSAAGAPTANLGGAALIVETGAGAVKTVTVQDGQPINGGVASHRFLRLRVTRP